MNEFENYGISHSLKQALNQLNYSVPTEVQKKSIPAILEERNVVCESHTGSGKTIAFSLPLIERVIQGKSKKVLVVCPTRELALQVKDEIYKLNKFTGLKAFAVFGGHGINLERTELKRNYSFLIATPGRLLDHFRSRTIDPPSFDTVVLDEADRLLDMGFIDDLKKILTQINPEKTHLFSATLRGNVERLIHQYIADYKEIRIEQQIIGTNIIEKEITVNRENKFSKLLNIVNSNKGKFLVFVATKRGADFLSRKMNNARIRNAVIHGDKSNKYRIMSLNDFRQGKHNILIATDVASRGLQINNVDYVVNYDQARDYHTHVHRIGRTGRMGQKGTAINFSE